MREPAWSWQTAFPVRLLVENGHTVPFENSATSEPKVRVAICVGCRCARWSANQSRHTNCVFTQLVCLLSPAPWLPLLFTSDKKLCTLSVHCVFYPVSHTVLCTNNISVDGAFQLGKAHTL